MSIDKIVVTLLLLFAAAGIGYMVYKSNRGNTDGPDGKD